MSDATSLLTSLLEGTRPLQQLNRAQSNGSGNQQQQAGGVPMSGDLLALFSQNAAAAPSPAHAMSPPPPQPQSQSQQQQAQTSVLDALFAGFPIRSHPSSAVQSPPIKSENQSPPPPQQQQQPQQHEINTERLRAKIEQFDINASEIEGDITTADDWEHEDSEADHRKHGGSAKNSSSEQRNKTPTAVKSQFDYVSPFQMLQDTAPKANMAPAQKKVSDTHEAKGSKNILQLDPTKSVTGPVLVTTPITLLSTVLSDPTPGLKVGAKFEGCYAYAMKKSRVRLISSSGYKALLKAGAGAIVDIAIRPGKDRGEVVVVTDCGQVTLHHAPGIWVSEPKDIRSQVLLVKAGRRALWTSSGDFVVILSDNTVSFYHPVSGEELGLISIPGLLHIAICKQYLIALSAEGVAVYSSSLPGRNPQPIHHLKIKNSQGIDAMHLTKDGFLLQRENGRSLDFFGPMSAPKLRSSASWAGVGPVHWAVLPGDILVGTEGLDSFDERLWLEIHLSKDGFDAESSKVQSRKELLFHIPDLDDGMNDMGVPISISPMVEGSGQVVILHTKGANLIDIAGRPQSVSTNKPSKAEPAFTQPAKNAKVAKVEDSMGSPAQLGKTQSKPKRKPTGEISSSPSVTNGSALLNTASAGESYVNSSLTESAILTQVSLALKAERAHVAALVERQSDLTHKFIKKCVESSKNEDLLARIIAAHESIVLREDERRAREREQAKRLAEVDLRRTQWEEALVAENLQLKIDLQQVTEVVGSFHQTMSGLNARILELQQTVNSQHRSRAQDLPQPPHQAAIALGPASTINQRRDDIEDRFLTTLQDQNPAALPMLLSRHDPARSMPQLSQAVILALLHRLSTNSYNQQFTPWLRASAISLDPLSPLIASHCSRILGNVIQSLEILYSHGEMEALDILRIIAPKRV